jgi:hypothetical protein
MKTQSSARHFASADLRCKPVKTGESYHCLRCYERMGLFQVRTCQWAVAQQLAAIEEDMQARRSSGTDK